MRYRPCYTTGGATFYEMYSYSAGGLLLKKRFRVNRNGVDADLDAEWTYDNDGKLTTVRYPLGAVYQHGYDEMGRPKTMVDAGTQTTIVGSATYGPAGELLTMGNESRQYNSRLQVTRITYPTQDWEYKYSATQNNGQITAMKDWTSGEEVNYAYDELKRLASAVTVGPEWGNSYVYDGFGNLLQKNVVKGSAPYMNLSIDPATNKPYSGYSAAGLPTVGAQFDNDNRMIATTAGSSYQEYYAYSPAGKRVWNRGKRDIGGTWMDMEEVWFWGVTGQRMAFYALTASGNPVFTLTSTNLYMGSKLVMSGGVAVKTDRLGSVGKFYPWGEERTPTGASGEKFATYYHDVQAAMNYADQRWHGTNGRFQVPDPFGGSAGTEDPASWNRYRYVDGDPINKLDPSGLLTCSVYTDENDAPYVFCSPGPGDFPEPPSVAPAPPPECNPDSQTYRFVLNNLDAAKVLGFETSVPADFILAWAAWEGSWGGAANVRFNGNFFGLTTTRDAFDPGTGTGLWQGAIPCEPRGIHWNHGYACFETGMTNTLLASGRAALWSQQGRYLEPLVLSLWTDGDYAKALQAVANAGFEKTNPQYGIKIMGGVLSSGLKTGGSLSIVRNILAKCFDSNGRPKYGNSN